MELIATSSSPVEGGGHASMDVGHLPGGSHHPEEALRGCTEADRDHCATGINRESTQKSRGIFGQAARCREQAKTTSLLSLQACSRMVWTGWLGWIPRSGLPSHIHTQNVCGTVNHFFKYRMTAGTAVRRFMSARLPQDTSSFRDGVEKKQLMESTNQELPRHPCH